VLLDPVSLGLKYSALRIILASLRVYGPPRLTYREVAGKPLLFIDGLNKPEANKRKQIRKYVMLGKNRGKTRNVRPASTIEPHIKSPRGLVESPDLVVKMNYPAIPNKVGDELSFTRFAAPVAPQLMRDILKCKLLATSAHVPRF
jgi:hypothetical protein